MKIQDIAFIIVFLAVLLKRNPTLSALIGIICLILSMPLFSLWVFFTAERLTWYSAVFFALSAFFHLVHKEKKK